MKYGFVRCEAITPRIKVGNPKYNAGEIIKLIAEAKSDGSEIVVFPELCVTGYTAMDMFFTRDLLSEAVEAVKAIAAQTPKNMLVFVGAPIVENGRLYNCAIALSNGKVLGVIPKTELPDYGEFYEKRYFTPNAGGVVTCSSLNAPMGDVLFKCKNSELIVGAEICEDMWADVSPSVDMCRAGATVIANLSASDEVVGKAEYRRLLVRGVSGKLHCAYIYADAGYGESSTDVVFSAHNIIAENGSILKESAPFECEVTVVDIDFERLDAERRKIGVKQPSRKYEFVEFELEDTTGRKDKNALLRTVGKEPFVPSEQDRKARSELILNMQTQALKKRMESTKSKTLVLGVSGGLDSTLALLVCARATEAKNIVAVTMPCFGTTDKTLNNAHALCNALGVELKTIDIKNTVTAHLKDLAHNKTDVTYENAQARTRTMTLFDLANKTNGLVVGTGDLSELALGWATYNGDHMSAYGVNAGVPKTLVKCLVKAEGERVGGSLKTAVEGILKTEISPELLPPENGKIAQKTEDILGKYELLDFVIYYYLRYGFSRDKIAFLMDCAYPDEKPEEKAKAINTFYTRFFRSQFKRSCLPDGVKIGSVSLSPRSDFRLPSDLE
ncbi:MAG: NAD(+) synthase [Clostridiales bacterium]|nr:NAD(+) synthase [Clostridiales bacterium]